MLLTKDWLILPAVEHVDCYKVRSLCQLNCKEHKSIATYTHIY